MHRLVRNDAEIYDRLYVDVSSILFLKLVFLIKAL